MKKRQRSRKTQKTEEKKIGSVDDQAVTGCKGDAEVNGMNRGETVWRCIPLPLQKKKGLR